MGTRTVQGASLDPSAERLGTPIRIGHIAATVRDPQSVERLRRDVASSLGLEPSESFLSGPCEVSIYQESDNARAAREADVVILGCKPHSLANVLGNNGVRQSLFGRKHGAAHADRSKGRPKRKLLVSLVGGISISRLGECLHGSLESRAGERVDGTGCVYEDSFIREQDTPGDARLEPAPEYETPHGANVAVFRAVTSIACCVQKSVTVLSPAQSNSRPHSRIDSAPEESAEEQEEQDDLRSALTDLFSLVGPTKWLPERQLDHASALAASSLAIYASIMLAASTSFHSQSDSADTSPGTNLTSPVHNVATPDHNDGGGASETRVSAADAIWISANAALGASHLILDGMSTEKLVAKVATQGGSTAQALQFLAQRGVGTAVAGAVEVCTDATAGLGSLGDKPN